MNRGTQAQHRPQVDQVSQSWCEAFEWQVAEALVVKLVSYLVPVGGRREAKCAQGIAQVQAFGCVALGTMNEDLETVSGQQDNRKQEPGAVTPFASVG